MEQVEIIDVSAQQNQDKGIENSKEEEKEAMSDGEKEESEGSLQQEIQKPQISRIEHEILKNLPESINEIKPVDVSYQSIICYSLKP